MIDRLRLDARRIEAIASTLESIATLPDPVGQIISKWMRPNGLSFVRTRVSIGVIGIIYESRPNVTADAAALCVMAGNACILRGGSESLNSNIALHNAIANAFRTAGLPQWASQLIESTDRSIVGAMLEADELIDVIIPRGGKRLITRVKNEGRMAVLAHLDGVCQVYVDSSADQAMAEAIVLNAKMRRTGVCNAAEIILVDQSVRPLALRLCKALLDANCRVRVSPELLNLDPRVELAVEDDWRTEYLDATVSLKLVDGVVDAIHHINLYGSHHTDCIVAQDPGTAEQFLQGVDSAVVMHNASTQFSDGSEFGMGAEIGTATGRLHARGPVGLEGLTTYKTLVYGNGAVRT